MESRKSKADEKYRRLFYERGLDQDFEYVCFERKDQIRVKCKRCGSEVLRTKDAFVGRTNKLVCKDCGAGRVMHSIFADEVMDFYSSGHSVKETCQRYDLDKTRLNSWVKARRVSNGRDWATEANAERIDAMRLKVDEVCRAKGLILLDVWQGKRYVYKVLDERMGVIREIRGSSLLRGATRPKQSRLKNVEREPGINVIKLIERDGDRCYICGKKFDFEDLRWRNWGPDYPSIDHVVPIAKGGKHDWQNVKACCGACNVRKGANLCEGQKQLI